MTGQGTSASWRIAIARAVTLGDGKIIDVADLPPAIRSEQADTGMVTSQDATTLSTTALADMERMTILRVFEQANGDKALAGKMLGISARRYTEN